MKQHDVFIEKYKELERMLTVPVREYEDSLPEEEAQKMRICRLLRNYIQHNADYEKIISISSGLQQYLDSVVDSLHKKNGLLKEHMCTATKYGFVSETDTVIDTAALITKKNRNDSIVLDKDGGYLGVINKSIISDAFGTGTITKATKVSKLAEALEKPKILYLTQTTSMDIVNDTVKDELVLVTNNAKKIVGIYNYSKKED